MSGLSLSYLYYISTNAQRSPFSFLQGLSKFFTPFLGFLSDVRAKFLEEERKGCISQESTLSNTASRVWLLLLTTMKVNLLTSRALNVKKKCVFCILFQTYNSKTLRVISTQQQKLASTRDLRQKVPNMTKLVKKREKD